jgi:hypothetical protein
MKIAIHYNGVAIWRYAALEARDMPLGSGSEIGVIAITVQLCMDEITV